MEKVALLTEQQKEQLVGTLLQPHWYFNPIQDLDDNWIISLEEIENNIYPDNNWINSLPLIDYNPKPQPPIPN